MLLILAAYRLYPRRDPDICCRIKKPGNIARCQPRLYARANAWRIPKAQPPCMVVGDRNPILYSGPDRRSCCSSIAALGCYRAWNFDADCGINLRVAPSRNAIRRLARNASHEVFPPVSCRDIGQFTYIWRPGATDDSADRLGYGI